MEPIKKADVGNIHRIINCRTVQLMAAERRLGRPLDRSPAGMFAHEVIEPTRIAWLKRQIDKAVDELGAK